MRIVTGTDMRLMDQWTIEERGVSADVLMENAGKNVALETWEYLKQKSDQVVILAGKGNNGGDALVAARHLYQWGAHIRVFLTCPPEDFGGSAAGNWRLVEALGIPWNILKDHNSFYPFKLALHSARLVVDGLFGTGFRGEMNEVCSKAVQAVTESRAPVLAIDVPSGLNADTGQVSAWTVRAEKTVSLAFGKLGLYVYPGKEYAGEVVISDISIPGDAIDIAAQTVHLADRKMAKSLLPAVPVEGHKYTFGHVLTAAGSRGMAGAALLASRAALRSGAGMVTTLLPESLADSFDLAFPEGLTKGLPETDAGALSKDAADALEAEAEGKSALVFGPGMRPGDDLEFLLTKAAGLRIPLILDGGGLWALSRNPSLLANRAATVVLTPHAGELGRLLNVSAAEIQNDRLKAAGEAALKFQSVVVLKGAATVTATPLGTLYVNHTGNPALATAGTGDVLAGAIGAWMAQGLQAEEAAVLGVYLHGLAGDLFGQGMGFRGILAGDLTENLFAAREHLRLGQ
jgi:NAD(P)H-hydrate epimerase